MKRTKKRNWNDSDFKEVEKIGVIPTREGEELHFSIVEVDGKTRGDIRYFVDHSGQMLHSRRGILIPEKNAQAFKEQVDKLVQNLEEK